MSAQPAWSGGAACERAGVADRFRQGAEPGAHKARGSAGSQTRAAAISAASLALFFTRAMLVTRLRPAVSSSMRPST